MFKSLFRWVVLHLQKSAKVQGQKALQRGVQVAQDVLEGDNVNTAVSKRVKQALVDVSSQNSSQSGEGQKVIKKESTNLNLQLE